jgi:putative endonuclease
VSRALCAEAQARAAHLQQRKRVRGRHRNMTCGGGEREHVWEDGDTLVFVEVRARKDDRHGTPLETVQDLKRRRLIRAAEIYIARNGLWDRACRFDVVAIAGDAIEHVADAFATT